MGGVEEGPPHRALGPYRLGRRIGSGAMGSVFEATHDKLGKSVALKILHTHIADEPRAVARFLREGQAAARLRHPHVVSVIDAGVGAEGTPYLVMELERGETLASMLRTFGVLEPEQAVDLILPLLSAIQHAHSLGIVHRDIKPANILISSDHVGDSVAKLADFGISRLAESATEQSLTADRGLLGTLPYMSPEQLVAAHQATAASDQYAIGVVLYECLTGRLPFEAAGTIELASAILHAPFTPPGAKNPKLPQALNQVVCRALEREADKRFPTIPALGEALLPFASEHVALVCSREFASWSDNRASRVPVAMGIGNTADDERLSLPPASPGRMGTVRKGLVAAALLGVIGALALIRWHEPSSDVEVRTTAFVTPSPVPTPAPAPTVEAPPSTGIDIAPSPLASDLPPIVASAPSVLLPVRKTSKDSSGHVRPLSSPTSPSARPSVATQPSAEDNGAPILD
jgi:serine/threonine-protein kinase